MGELAAGIVLGATGSGHLQADNETFEGLWKKATAVPHSVTERDGFTIDREELIRNFHEIEREIEGGSYELYAEVLRRTGAPFSPAPAGVAPARRVTPAHAASDSRSAMICCCCEAGAWPLPPLWMTPAPEIQTLCQCEANTRPPAFAYDFSAAVSSIVSCRQIDCGMLRQLPVRSM